MQKSKRDAPKLRLPHVQRFACSPRPTADSVGTRNTSLICAFLATLYVSSKAQHAEQTASQPRGPELSTDHGCLSVGSMLFQSASEIGRVVSRNLTSFLTTPSDLRDFDTACVLFKLRRILFLLAIEVTPDSPVPALCSGAFEWFVMNRRTDVALPCQIFNVCKDRSQHIVLRVVCITGEFFDLQYIVWLAVGLFQRIVDKDRVRLVPYTKSWAWLLSARKNQIFLPGCGSLYYRILPQPLKPLVDSNILVDE